MAIRTGNDVRTIREARGITQEALSVMAGVSERSIRRTENGDAVSMETMKCIAAALDETLELGERAPETAEAERPKVGEVANALFESAFRYVLLTVVITAAFGIAHRIWTAGDHRLTIVAAILFTWAVVVGAIDHLRTKREKGARPKPRPPTGPSRYALMTPAGKVAFNAALGAYCAAIAAAAAYCVATRASFLQGRLGPMIDADTLPGVIVVAFTFAIAGAVAALVHATSPKPMPGHGSGAA